MLIIGVSKIETRGEKTVKNITESFPDLKDALLLERAHSLSSLVDYSSTRHITVECHVSWDRENIS